VAALGLAFIGASVGHLIAAGALIVLLMVKSRLEERMLLGQYRDYAAYAARVGRLVPGVGRIRS
jgi:protein-S-isoprenylcysteine O-methyltransferase Ste14